MNSKKKRALVATLAGLLALLIILPIIVTIVSSLNASAVSEEELEQLQEQADELAAQQETLSGQIYELQTQQAAILSQKELLDERVELTRAEIANLTQQIVLLDGQIVEKEAEYAAAQEAEAEQYELFKKRVRAMEENGTISYFSILFEAKNFSDLLSRLDFVTEIMDSDERVVEDLEAAQAATAKAKDDLETLKSIAEDSRARQYKKEEELLAQIADAETLIAQLEENKAEFEKAYAENEAREAEIAAEIDEMIAELERIAAEQQAAAGGNIVSTGTYRWPSDSSLYVTSAFGTRFHPILLEYRTHNGIDIGASYGTPVLASDSGVVVTSTYDSSYGYYIMISHGDGRYTLYAHMSELYSSEGDYVSQGETIGLVGSTGWSTGPHIHFEIYEDGVRIDPLQFFDNYIPWWD